ncbi:SDR family NAD(P)-dependent oxidoreductase [Ensifer soli]|uniref:SDR family NAD(P)-dependent oxidoreductase n=1 Tax=Ciceribacter sp. sgz301302 TaxID=3342379 RepID=UPI0035BB982D
MDGRLQGKVAIVTGAAQGLGEAIARAMAAEGAIVAGCDVKKEEGRAVFASLDPSGERSLFSRVDLADEASVRAFVAAVRQRFGRIDILVNNAAILPPPGRSLPEMAEADWSRVLDINVGGAFRITGAVLPAMIEQKGGAVISLSSVHRSHSIPGFTAYAASKGAIVSMTRQLALEYGAQGIRFNTISPGAIATAMTQAILDGDPTGGLTARFRHMHALERIGRPEEVAATAVFLASDGAGFITGEDILVDGGLTKATRLDF